MVDKGLSITEELNSSNVYVAGIEAGAIAPDVAAGVNSAVAVKEVTLLTTGAVAQTKTVNGTIYKLIGLRVTTSGTMTPTYASVALPQETWEAGDHAHCPTSVVIGNAVVYALYGA